MFSKTYSTDGTGSFASFTPVPGDCAAIVRYSTADRSSKNHPIYCFNYFHGVGSPGAAANKDLLLTVQLTAMGVYANDWITGFSDGANTYKRARPTGSTCTGALVETLLTHRDLPR